MYIFTFYNTYIFNSVFKIAEKTAAKISDFSIDIYIMYIVGFQRFKGWGDEKKEGGGVRER